MNRNDFNRFVSDGIIPEKDDIAGLRELTELFPWFQAAHLALLRGLKESSDIKFDSQLKNSALYVADREILYHYLFMSPSSPTVLKAEIPIQQAEPLKKAEPDLVAEAVPEQVEIAKDQSAITGENEPVQEPETVSSDVQSSTEELRDSSLRTREDLISEIEERLKEIGQPSPGEKVPLISEPVQPAESVEMEVVAEEVQVNEVTVPFVEVKQPEETVFEIEIKPLPSDHTEEPDESLPLGDELLELMPVEEQIEEKPEIQLSPAELIDRFIMTSPRIERATVRESEPVEDLSVESTVEKGSFITETLARIYVTQGYYSKAINIYEKLALKYPEKSIYFASRIEKIKELIK